MFGVKRDLTGQEKAYEHQYHICAPWETAGRKLLRHEDTEATGHQSLNDGPTATGSSICTTPFYITNAPIFCLYF